MSNDVSIGGSRKFVRLGLITAVFVLGATFSACARDGVAKTQSQESAANADTSAAGLLATVGDERVTMEDVKNRVGTTLDKLENQYLRARSKVIDTALASLVLEHLLQAEAKKQGKSLEELLASEGGKDLEPSQEDVSAWYQQNQLQVRGQSLSQASAQIVGYLRRQRRKEAMQKLEVRLGQDAKVKINFQPFRYTLDNEGAPALGKKGAPVTLVEFSDFQCPYCQGFAPTLKKVEKEFGDKVYVVYRQYPIPSLHPFAQKAAEASLCAQEQGKFWELHDLMFSDQTRLSVSDLKEKAGKLGMNRSKFNSCLDSGRYVERIQRDVDEAMRSGVTGTPAVFINGTPVDGGAVPYDVVSAAIQRELARVTRSN